MPKHERSGEAVSQPIKHSPGPWSVGCYRYDIRNVPEDRGEEAAILGADGKSIVEMNPYGTTGTDEDLKLIAAAPTMYRILRVIIQRRDGLIEWDAMSEAHRLIRELEG
jgi:hypothetical protein